MYRFLPSSQCLLLSKEVCCPMLNPWPDWPDLLKLSKHLNSFHFPWVANYGIYFHWIFCVWPFHHFLPSLFLFCATIALRDSLLLLLCLSNCSHFISFLPTVLHLLYLWSQMRARASLARKLNCAVSNVSSSSTPTSSTWAAAYGAHSL